MKERLKEGDCGGGAQKGRCSLKERLKEGYA